MVFELAAARMLAPSIGGSIYVWTSVIGVIIAALSLGYWLGGTLADKRTKPTDIVWLCMAVAVSIVGVVLVSDNVMSLVVQSVGDARIQGVLISLFLFAPTSLLIGMISPYITKLNISSLETSGKSVAGITALDAIGGITGTFLAGFVLFGILGVRESFIVVAVLFVLTSWVIAPWYKTAQRAAVSLTLCIVGVAVLASSGQLVVETPSASYAINEARVRQTGDRVRTLATGPSGIQSAVSLSDPQRLVLWYAEQTQATIERNTSQPRTIAILGGGAYSLPRSLSAAYPEAQIDVIEIDPELEAISEKYFAYSKPANVTTIAEDARSYLNRTAIKYDVVVVDVFGDILTPFSLSTHEFSQQLRRAVTPDGLVVVNIVAGNGTECRQLLSQLDAPFRAAFSHQSYSVDPTFKTKGNIVAAYQNTPINMPNQTTLSIPPAEVFYDNYAPLEPLQQRCLAQL